MIAYDPSGALIVLADGSELLVHDGPSEGPLWRRTEEHPIVAVGAAAGSVISVDRSGRARWFDARRDHVQATVATGSPTHAADVAANGDLLLAHADGARVLTRGGPGPRIDWPDARAVAWADDGRMLVAGNDGTAGEFDPRGQLLHRVQLDAPIVAATWNPQGFWILATARKFVRLVGGELHHLTSAPEDMPVRAVACAGDGSRIGFALGDDLVLVLAWPSRDNVGQLRYLDRKVSGLAFGPAPWLGVGLDGGDGNKFDLQTGDLSRTDTHPGRPHRRWLVKCSANPPADASTTAPTARPAASTTRPTAPAYAPPTTAPAARSNLGTLLLTLAITLAVLFALARLAL